jgi:hypothetical protein
VVVEFGNFAPERQKYHGQGHIVAAILGEPDTYREIADGGLRLKAGRFFACLAMVGAGAIAGTLSGGYTNAARSPAPAPAGVAASHVTAEAQPATKVAAEYSEANTTSVAMTSIGELRAKSVPLESVPLQAVPQGPAPAAVIAERFPSNWPQQARRVANADNDPPPVAMAYAAEPQRPAAEPQRPATATGGFALASVDTNANPEPVPMPRRIARPERPKPAVLFNDAQLASIKTRLRLTRDQEQYWPQVESALRAISWKLATQQKGIVGRNQAQMIDPNSPEVARLKSAAFPLIMSMREDQKQEVRQLAHTMGLKQVATMF